jgi:DNA polymerase-4
MRCGHLDAARYGRSSSAPSYAFLAVTATDPVAFAADVRAAVAERAGLSCAVGIGETKQRAKLAVAPVKPGGIGMITEADWAPLMADRPVDALWGIGPRLARALAAAGVHTVGELAAADPAVLAERFGPTIGLRLWRLGRGEDESPVSGEQREPRSRSRSVTFPEDLTRREDVEREVVALAGEVTRGTVAAGYEVARVAVTVRTSTFFTRTRITTLPAPTVDAAVVERAALAVLDRFPLDRPVRLLGVRVEYGGAGATDP